MYYIPLNQYDFAGCWYALCRLLKSFHKSLRISLIPKSFSFCNITPSFRFILNLYDDISQNQCSVLLHHLGQKCAAAFKFLTQSFPPSLVASASHQNNSDNSFLDDTATLRKRQYFQFKKTPFTYSRNLLSASFLYRFLMVSSARYAFCISTPKCILLGGISPKTHNIYIGASLFGVTFKKVLHFWEPLSKRYSTF